MNLGRHNSIYKIYKIRVLRKNSIKNVHNLCQEKCDWPEGVRIGSNWSEWRAIASCSGDSILSLSLNFMETNCFQVMVPSLLFSPSPPSLSAGNLVPSLILLEILSNLKSSPFPYPSPQYPPLHTFCQAFLPIMAFDLLVAFRCGQTLPLR